MFARPLWERSLVDHARNIVSWIAGIVVLVVVQLLVYPTIRDSSAGWSNVTQDFPEVIKEILRMSDYTSETGYLNTELMSFTVPFIFIMMGATWGARAGTEDEEQGTADIVLSLPMTRRSYLISRTVAALTVIVFATVAFVVTLIVGARLLDMSIPIARFIAAGSALLALGTLTTTLALMVGTLTGRRGVSLGVATAVAIASFVVYSLAPLVDFFADIEPTSLFRWTIGTQPLTEGVSAGYLLLSLGVAAALTAISTRIFDRRDITV